MKVNFYQVDTEYLVRAINAFNEKDDLKKLGFKWNPDCKVWEKKIKSDEAKEMYERLKNLFNLKDLDFSGVYEYIEFKDNQPQVYGYIWEKPMQKEPFPIGTEVYDEILTDKPCYIVEITYNCKNVKIYRYATQDNEYSYFATEKEIYEMVKK